MCAVVRLRPYGTVWENERFVQRWKRATCGGGELQPWWLGAPSSILAEVGCDRAQAGTSSIQPRLWVEQVGRRVRKLLAVYVGEHFLRESSLSETRH